jgi:hypothetical protein
MIIYYGRICTKETEESIFFFTTFKSSDSVMTVKLWLSGCMCSCSLICARKYCNGGLEGTITGSEFLHLDLSHFKTELYLQFTFYEKKITELPINGNFAA